MKQFSFGTQKSNRARLAFAAVMSLATSSLHAHPGHALADQGVAHLLTSPYHLTMLTAIGLALVLGGRLFRRPLIRRWMQLGGAASLLAAAILWGTGA
jgi:hydrogenase/urease accessory protein HupE